MKQVGTFIAVVVMGLLVGCGPVGPEEAGGQELTPELVARAEPDAQMLQGLTAVCQPTTTNSCVNAGYGS
ncbi:MAG TPA: hypothetical protein VEU33_42400, partial [Archangium sp.]|nr:hypothetical protein [Archangium sp.]